MDDFEKIGAFYLGKLINLKDGKLTEELLLYDSKDLTTHAVCLGMTGSGKTGLGVTILEEAGLDKIPAIVIDPKGDLGNLLLTFPSLSANEFKPWIDPAEAERKGMDTNAYAESVAETWKNGLEKWGEGSDRIKKFKNSVDVVIYTPASKAGIPLSILSSFAAPSKEMMLDSSAVRDRVLSVTSSLLGLLGIHADPINSREHILISTIITNSWEKGKDLDIASLVQQVQQPPFTKIGVLDLNTSYPPRERMALSISLNNLLASPGFKAWMEGDALDINQLLHTSEGKPKISVISIAHLSDPERMFFVTLLLNEILSWMRKQTGTSSLRALLYMDEIFGYFPPTAMPPSKLPMLTMLKQARAFGLGVVLATQNPVDLDYKGLANCGTWFIGKLQTERDKARVLEGLTIASNGEFRANELDKMLALTGNRTFIMRSIYKKDPVLFQTRWSMSYLRGPMTLTQIEKLTKRPAEKASNKLAVKAVPVLEAKPLPPVGIAEYFLQKANAQKPVHYKPEVLALAKLHFVDLKNKIDAWNDICMIVPPDEDGQSLRWEDGKNDLDAKRMLESTPLPDAKFDELPAGLMQKQSYAAFEKNFATYLYQSELYKIYKAADLNLISNEGETEGVFRARAALAMRERRDELIAKIRSKYSDKIATLTERIRKNEEKMSIQKKQTFMRIVEAIISFCAMVLSALMGKRLTQGTITQTGTSMRKVGRITKESQETSQTEGNINATQQQLDDLKSQMKDEIDKLIQQNADDLVLETVDIRPRKSDISVEKVALVWCPE
ncbi:MAG TPA: DUF87 domain-containing protein [Parachlamydiaceae bacterium]|nr:DUF87 domain-containing protein [Parachlamydiaceae bacterium]